ncbi:MAG: DNA polymerase III subunit delta' [Marinosulfonomonas sp.]|nr:DNA polymerase III subunit delta' [Marinosulfonomonas sp.]
MSDDEPTPEFDRVQGATHPRHTAQLLGQQAAETTFLTAYTSSRLHHGWLISGPRGIGKATLAWRIARFLLAQPPASDGLFGDAPQAPTSLDIPPDHPVVRRTAALSEPRLFLLRTNWNPEKKRFNQGIVVEDARKLKAFFNLSAADGGRRVVIVDSADELNVSAANALLKFLEEPPDDVIILLVCHRPSRLLPTIRSRCRELRCATLSASDLGRAMSAAGSDSNGDEKALAELAGGSVGDAVRLNNLHGMDTYAQLVALFATLPQLDRPKALTLAESVAGRGKEQQVDLLVGLINQFIARTARTGVSGPPLVQATPGESEVLQRLAPNPDAGRKWAQLQQVLSARAAHGRAVNLDPAALILDMVFKINELAAKLVAR